MSGRLVALLLVAAGLAQPTLARPPVSPVVQGLAEPGQATLLAREEAMLLRRAVLESRDLVTAPDPVEAVAAWLRGESGLSAAAFDALSTRLQGDANLRKAILELAGRRVHWRSEPRGAFVAWWDPRQQDAGGRPSSGLSPADADELSRHLGSLARELEIPVPSAIPYVIDLRPGLERVRGPNSVRWGIVTQDPRDRAAVAKLLLLEVGDSAFVVEPLSRLRACPDRDCRRDLLDRARGVVIRSGYVPIVEGLQASAFAGEDDPAFASALLVVDRIDRLHPGRTFRALLLALEEAQGPSQLRGAFFRATGEGPARLDKLIQVELSEWARARAKLEAQAGGPPPRPEPPARSW